MLKPFLEQLIKRQNLSNLQCRQAIELILGDVPAEQVAAFLALLHAKPITADELYAFAMVMRNHMITIPVNEPLLDIVGTGGDGLQTINISTASSILAAACGVKVAKNGNRSVSSACGAADFLEACGIPIALTASQVIESIKLFNIGFCYAPSFHPAMAHLKTIRRRLGIATTFNLLGPLLNPAQAQYYLLGTADPRNLSLLAEVLFKLKVKHGLVVHSGGLDELSLLAPAQVIEVTPAGLKAFIIDPKQYGFKYAHLSDITGTTAIFNVERVKEVFMGKSNALADTIILNTGTALYVAEKVASIEEGIYLARKKLQEQAAWHLLEQWRTFQPG